MKNDEMRKASLDGDIYRRGRTDRLIIRLIMLGWLDKRRDLVRGVGSGKTGRALRWRMHQDTEPGDLGLPGRSLVHEVSIGFPNT